jgi:hypothetical protein
MNNAADLRAEALPAYLCHKRVRAMKIGAIVREELPKFSGATCKGSIALGSACGHCERCAWEKTGSGGGAVLVPSDPRLPNITVDQAYLAKHEPAVGGYFVLYDDGYQSFSPAKAFEDGYTLAEMNALELGSAVRAAGLAGK